MARLKPRFIFFVLFLVVSVLMAGFFFNKKSPVKDLYSFYQQEAVFNEVLFKVKPVIDADTIRIKVTVESYQNQDFLKYDLSEIVILTCDNMLYDKLSWKIVKAETYTVTGELIVNNLQQSKIKHLKLQFFLGNELNFDWKSVN
jgi:hypothetical protein